MWYIFEKALGTRVSKIMIPAVKYKVSTSNESITATLYQQQQVSLTWLARRPPHTLLRKPVVASPLSENREHCRHLSHFPPQIWKIWKIAIQQVRSPAWWSETVRQHMNTTGLLNIGKGKPTKTNEFLDMFRRGRGWWVKSILLSNVSCTDFSL